jgi:ankyrin repeat protein
MLSNRFRWVYCQLVALRECLPKNLRQILKELPKSLDETYQRILKEINNANQKEAHRLLQCLAVAYRPLRIEELTEVLALDVDAGGIPKFNDNWRWEDHEAAVLSTCSSLVSVINYNGSRVVQFAHFSVKEFLTSDRLASMADIYRFHIADEPSHAILAQACLGVLLCLEVHPSEDSLKDIPLFEYAAINWVGHAQVGNVELQIKDAMDCFFDIDKPHFAASLGGVDILRVLADSWDEELTDVLSVMPLYFTSGLGFSSLAERLITKRPQAINYRGPLAAGTPLHFSVQEGHIKVVRVLLAHGADINSRTANNSTPLHIASQGGDPELAKWFLNVMNSVAGASSLLKIVFFPLHLESLKGHPDSGVDFYTILLQHYREMHMNNSITNISLNSASKFDLEIAHVKCEIGRCTVANSQISNGATPLLGESSSRNIKIAQLLLDHNADVHMYDNSGNTPLHIAASGGHLEVTRILLQRNAGVNSRDDGGATPLFRASGHGHAHVVRLLLDHDADVHSRGPSRCTPLHIAAMNSHLEVARIFLERNAEINPKEDHGLTPLLLASHYGHTDVMRLLLDHNADVHVRYDTGKAKGMTPLHDAATKGHVEVTRLLLEHNAEVNSRDDSGATPLFRASENGQADVVRLLLDHDAEVHTRGYPGRTPLHMAAMNGHLEVTRILLECNAEINSQDDKRCTSLLLVSGKGHADVVRLLLDHNADVHTRGYSGCTPLHIAAMNGHLEIARILLECNAEINSKADDGWTPLIFATLDEHTDVVRLLLDRNADVHVRYDTGMTLLHKAATKGWVEVTRMLLERNAEVNSRDDSGATPAIQSITEWTS